MSNIVYYDDGDVAAYNGYLFRRDKKTGYYLSGKKIEDKRKRLHIYVYETEKGSIPKGYAVHHIDFDKNNNDISNLMLLTRSEHERLHGRCLTDEQKQRRRDNLNDRARPKAIEWHKSKEGKKWHSKHGKDVFCNLPIKTYKCSYCGKEFQTKNAYSKTSNTFCSNNCKSAFRRASGIDNIKRECAICGAEFTTNKYSYAKYCEKHRRGKNRV